MVERSVHGIRSTGPLKPLGGVQGRPDGVQAGVQGADPPEGPGFLGFLRPQKASPRIIFFSSFLRQVLLQNQFTMLIYDIRC